MGISVSPPSFEQTPGALPRRGSGYGTSFLDKNTLFGTCISLRGLTTAAPKMCKGFWVSVSAHRATRRLLMWQTHIRRGFYLKLVPLVASLERQGYATDAVTPAH